MTILGITGGIGAGKSTVTKMFAKFGADIIDADEISHKIMEKDENAYNDVLEKFGKGILDYSGNINRKKLASIVFNNKKELAILTKITHKYIFAEMEKQIKESVSELVCLDVPLLFSSDFPIRCNKTLVVTADINLRIARVIDRDRCTKEQVMERINKQMADVDMIRLADYVVKNDGDLISLENEIKKIYFELTR